MLLAVAGKEHEDGDASDLELNGRVSAQARVSSRELTSDFAHPP